MQSRRLRPQAVFRLRSIPHRARRRMADSNRRSTASRRMVGNLNRPDRRRSPKDMGSPRQANRCSRMAVSIHRRHRLPMVAGTGSHRSTVAIHRHRNRRPAHPARRIEVDGRRTTIRAARNCHGKRQYLRLTVFADTLFPTEEEAIISLPPWGRG